MPNNDSIKVVADSSCDLLTLPHISFETAPLKILTTEKEYVDDAHLDILEMVNDLQKYHGRSSSSCPNSDDWLRSFGDTQEIYCITITGTLSGSYNSALVARDLYLQQRPDRRVFVFNSLSAGPEIALLLEKLRELLQKGWPFDAVCAEISRYSTQTGLYFLLESMKNLANNGRVSPLVAKMAGLLGIRVVGKASVQGDLEPLDKCRGEEKALHAIVSHLRNEGLRTGKVRISHCFNENAAKALRKLLHKELPMVSVEISRCRGLCSFYAEKGGLLVGFEKF